RELKAPLRGGLMPRIEHDGHQSDLPVCAASVASRNFVTGAATPPLEEGNNLPLPNLYYPISTTQSLLPNLYYPISTTQSLLPNLYYPISTTQSLLPNPTQHSHHLLMNPPVGSNELFLIHRESTTGEIRYPSSGFFQNHKPCSSVPRM